MILKFSLDFLSSYIRGGGRVFPPRRGGFNRCPDIKLRIIHYELRISCNLYNFKSTHLQINSSSNQLIFKSAADGSEKPAGANAATQGAAGLRVRRHRCDYAMRA